MDLPSLRDQVMKALERVRPVRMPRRWLGLDLGNHAVKLVEVEQTVSGTRVVRHLIQELPRPEQGREIDRAGWLQSVLKEFEAREVYCAISGPEVVIRSVTVPPMPAREVAEAVRWQVKDQVPFPIQEARLATQVVGEVWQRDLKKQEVLFAATPRGALDRLAALVEGSGARLAGIVPSSLALWSCVAWRHADSTKGSAVVIEVGGKTTQVVIAKDGHPRMVRELPVGSESLTEALIGVVSSERGPVTVDRSMAEALTRRYGVLTSSVEGTTEEHVPLFHLASLMRPVLEQLLDELGRVLDYYKVQVDAEGVSRAFLCGGGASLKGLASFLADGVGIPVDLFNPLVTGAHRAQPAAADEAGPRDEEGLRLAVATGLALNRGRGMNLLVREDEGARKMTVPTRLVKVVSAGFAGVLIIVGLGLQAVSAWVGWQVGRERAAWERVAPASAECLAVTSARKDVERMIGQLEPLRDEQPVWNGMFKELGHLTPPTIRLDELAVEAAGDLVGSALHVRLTGGVAAIRGSGQGDISRFIEDLNRSIFFEDVELAGSVIHSGEASRTRFELEGRLE